VAELELLPTVALRFDTLLDVEGREDGDAMDPGRALSEDWEHRDTCVCVCVYVFA